MFSSPYEYYNNAILCVRASFLYDDTNIVSYDNYKKLSQRGALNVIRNARGKFNYALVEFKSMREDIKAQLTEIISPDVAAESMLTKYLVPDTKAAKFFVEYQDETGKCLKPSLQKTYLINVIVINAVMKLHDELMVEIYTRGGKKSKVYDALVQALDKVDKSQYPHTLPSSWRGLSRKIEQYKSEGPIVFIHGNIGNDNPLLIKGESAEWILANYSLPIKISVASLAVMYDDERRSKGWPKISEQAISLWLKKPENRRIWYLGRHGEEEYKNEFGHKLSIDKTQWFPNVMWAIDGSKLDWVHFEDNKSGFAAKIKIDPVVDVYSEKIIGWSFSDSESMEDHFTAIKMACNTSGVRPYQIQYDNQSGHKSARMQRLYTDIVAKDKGAHYPNKAYSHSNPIEQIFGRIQQQVLNKVWFSDKQSIKSKRLDSQPNMDFILENKHHLKNREDLIKLFEVMIENWNNAEHPRFKGQSRNEVYNHQMPHNEKFAFEEMSTIFWINETKSITYKSDGLLMKLKGQKYQFEVYDKDGNIDLEFRRKFIGEKFIVKYDPEHLNDYIKLYHVDHQKEQRFVCLAQPKRNHINIPLLHTPESKKAYLRDQAVKEIELERDAKMLKKLRTKTGITPESIIEDTELTIKLGARANKELRSLAESLEYTSDDALGDL